MGTVLDTIAVAPFVGAWIEITVWQEHINSRKSLRSSERGLKFNILSNKKTHKMSLRSSERGLKFM